MKKRGLSMLETVGIIILGSFFIFVIIFGFTKGWGNLSLQISAWFSPGESIASFSQACRDACSAGDNLTYCKDKRSVQASKFDEQLKFFKGEERFDSLAQKYNNNQITMAEIEKEYAKKKLSVGCRYLEDREIIAVCPISC